jgi:hypothetical protein
MAGKKHSRLELAALASSERSSQCSIAGPLADLPQKVSHGFMLQPNAMIEEQPILRSRYWRQKENMIMIIQGTQQPASPTLPHGCNSLFCCLVGVLTQELVLCLHVAGFFCFATMPHRHFAFL